MLLLPADMSILFHATWDALISERLRGHGISDLFLLKFKDPILCSIHSFDDCFLSSRPMRTMFCKQVADNLVIAKDESSPSAIAPTKIHSIRVNKGAPGVVDVVTNTEKKITDWGDLNLTRCQKAWICEQGQFFRGTKVWNALIWCGIHGVVSSLGQKLFGLIDVNQQ